MVAVVECILRKPPWFESRIANVSKIVRNLSVNKVLQYLARRW